MLLYKIVFNYRVIYYLLKYLVTTVLGQALFLSYIPPSEMMDLLCFSCLNPEYILKNIFIQDILGQRMPWLNICMALCPVPLQSVVRV